MIKKLYSAEKQEDEEDGEVDDRFGLLQVDPEKRAGEEKLNEAILNRERFSYSYWR